MGNVGLARGACSMGRSCYGESDERRVVDTASPCSQAGQCQCDLTAVVGRRALSQTLAGVWEKWSRHAQRDGDPGHSSLEVGAPAQVTASIYWRPVAYSVPCA